MKLKLFIIIFLHLLVFTEMSATIDSTWFLVKSIDDVKVYSSKTSDGFDAIMIDAVVHSDLKSFIKLINDADNYKKWVYGCSGSKKISEQGNVLLYSTVTDMPFPISDRYLKVLSTQQVFNDRWTSHSVAVEVKEKLDGIVIIKNFDSRWTVNQVEPNEIVIHYEVRTEPGGVIPAWLYNMAVDIGPYKTMENLKNKLENKL